MSTMKIVLGVVTLAIVGCSTEAPTVEIVEAGPEAIVVDDDSKDDLTIVVRYEDPNGDLGEGIARVVDCRSDEVVSELAIPKIANDEAILDGVAIEGELELVVTDVGALEPGALPKACEEMGVSAGAFCVVLVDAAGNESVPACTEAIAIESP